MANLKISELPLCAGIQESYEFAVVNNSSTPVTEKVTVTGMTFQGGASYLNALSDFSLVAPYNLVGTATDVLLTGLTEDTKRFESNGFISATIVYSSSTPSLTSYFYLDLDAGTTSPNFYLTDSQACYNSVTYIWRASNMNAGPHTLDLYVNLEDTVAFDFGQVILTFQEL